MSKSTSQLSEEDLECEHCGRAFTYRSEKARHLLSHSESRDEKCSVCDKNFKDAKHLLRHKKEVHGITWTDNAHNIWKCEWADCGSVFQTELELEKHGKAHTQSFEFKCSTCGNSYNHERGLKRHIREKHK